MPVLGAVRRSGPIAAVFPEGRQENSPGQSEAPSWDSIPSRFSRPVGGAAKTSITVRSVRPRSFRRPEFELCVFVIEPRNRRVARVSYRARSS